MRIEVLGVHPIETREPCHIIEMMIDIAVEDIDLSDITQELPGRTRDYWQVPYDEIWLTLDGTAPANEVDHSLRPNAKKLRLAFFFLI